MFADQYGIFHENVLEDFKTVLGVYGINEIEATMAIGINFWDFAGTGGYFVRLYLNDEIGIAAGQLKDLTSYRSGLRHEMGHAFNEILFPTYHRWFDEGMSQYVASGNEGWDGLKKRYELAKSNPTDPTSWRGNPWTHQLGFIFFGGLIEDYGLS